VRSTPGFVCPVVIPAIFARLKALPFGLIFALLALLSIPRLAVPADRLGSSGPSTASQTTAATPVAVAARDFAKLPLAFERNVGQVSNRSGNEVKFLSRGRGYLLFVTPTAAVLALRQSASEPDGARAGRRTARQSSSHTAVLRMQLSGAEQSANVEGLKELPGKSNYFIGNDPSRWRTGVSTYAEVVERTVYPGIDLVYHGNQGQVEYDFEVSPGADPRAIALVMEGARKLRLDSNGDLLVNVDGGALRFHKPVAYQQQGSARQIVPSRYVIKRKNRVQFWLASYDARRALVIDPILAYSSYLGGSSIEGANSIAVAPDGTAFVAGGTFSADFPTAHPLQPSAGGPVDFPQDAFVSKISADGSTLIYSTYLGGTNTDVAYGIAVDSAGEAYVAGATNSPNFPATPLAFDPECGGDGKCGASFNSGGLIVDNGFVTALNTAGSSLLYSTFVGGYQQADCLAIAVDANHIAYVTGEIGAPIIPTVNGPAPYLPIVGGFQADESGATDSFVVRIDATASDVLYSSYLGGGNEDIGYGIAADGSGNAYITGLTYSPDFPIVASSALQSTNQGSADAFLVKVDTNATGSASLAYSSFLGGTGLDQGNAIVVDSTGNAYIAGGTNSTSFPFTSPSGAYQPACALDSLGACEGAAFVAKLNPALSGNASLLYFTYLGGSRANSGQGIALDL
jgi:Beta-propeller repeat